MSTEIENLTEALSQLNEATKRTVEAIERITEHNIDEHAHPAIQERLSALEESDAIYTRAEIKLLIEEGIEEHVEKDFKHAHSGWTDFDDELTERLTDLTDRLTKVEKQISNNESSTDSNLQATLQAIADRYAKTLASLQAAYTVAANAGQTELANQYKATISATMNQERDELLQAMEAWQSTHGGSGSGGNSGSGGSTGSDESSSDTSDDATGALS